MFETGLTLKGFAAAGFVVEADVITNEPGEGEDELFFGQKSGFVDHGVVGGEIFHFTSEDGFRENLGGFCE